MQDRLTDCFHLSQTTTIPYGKLSIIIDDIVGGFCRQRTIKAFPIFNNPETDRRAKLGAG